MPLSSPEFRRRTLGFLKANLVLIALFAGFMLLVGGGGGIAWEAHLGGFVFGVFAARLFIEPAWKAVVSNKGLLPVLWQMFEGHPNLLPAFFEEDFTRSDREIEARILARLSPSPADEDLLIRDLGRSAATLNPAIQSLELQGRLTRLAGGRLALS